MHQNGTHFLRVSALHTIRLEISGNPDGIPVIVLHGGPGAGINDKERAGFDPAFYRIVSFDQRGAGQSTPPGETRENTTTDLIEDINKIRAHLNIGKFVLAGGSWGTTLALLYAQKHPDDVTGLVLRATYLNRQEDMDWMYGAHGVGNILNNHWKEFSSIIAPERRDDIVNAYEELIQHPDPSIQTEAASLWNEWPAPTATSPTRAVFNNQAERDDALNYAKVGVHYFNRFMFMQENQILLNIAPIRHIPVEMVHGAQDLIVRDVGAIAFKNAHPLAMLEIVPDAGHAISEPSLFEALCRATERMKTRMLPAQAPHCRNETQKLTI